MMTKKDYIAIAEVINNCQAVYKDSPSTTAQDGARYIALGIVGYMAQDNPDFDLDNFLKACGVK